MNYFGNSIKKSIRETYSDIQRVFTKRTLFFPLFVAALFLPKATLASDSVQTITFASGSDWSVFSADPGPAANSQGRSYLGDAQKVCASNQPFPCPNGSVDYGWPFLS
jgi:hypothetical protein